VVDKLVNKNWEHLGFYYRKIAKSGNSRYLSVGTILPKDWEIVKVFVTWEGKQTVCLKLEVIK